jgi:hypothetical protein
MNRPTPIVFFSLCAVVDFFFGLIKWHSVFSGVIAIVCGLPLSALLYFLLRAFEKGNDEPDDPR